MDLPKCMFCKSLQKIPVSDNYSFHSIFCHSFSQDIILSTYYVPGKFIFSRILAAELIHTSTCRNDNLGHSDDLEWDKNQGDKFGGF